MKGKKEALPYLILILGLCALALGSALWPRAGGESFLTSLERHEAERGVRLRVTGEYAGVEASRDVVVYVKPKETTREDIRQRLLACKERLPELILGENESLRQVKEPLYLIEQDGKTGVVLRWESDHPRLVDEKGRVNRLAAESNPYATLRAELFLEGQTDQWSCRVRVIQPLQGKQIEKAIQEAIEKERGRLSENTSGQALSLTKRTEEGVGLKWESASPFGIGFYIFSAAGGCLIIYDYRRRKKHRLQEAQRFQVEMDFPDFLDKIVIMLYAGLVLTDAFDRIARDYRQYRGKENRRILYEEWLRVLEHAGNSNGSLAEGLLTLGKRWEVKALTRFTILAADHLQRGNPLAERLLEESRNLRNQQKSRAEELGRLADTKLTFPLLLILMALVVMTVAPTMLEMGI